MFILYNTLEIDALLTDQWSTPHCFRDSTPFSLDLQAVLWDTPEPALILKLRHHLSALTWVAQ